MNTFVRRRIDVTLELANDQRFEGQGNANIIHLRGLRVKADIKKIGQFGEGWQASLSIFGMLEADMNALSVLSFNSMAVQLNKVRVSVGDEHVMTPVFSGHIVNGWIDYANSPEVCFVIEAMPDYYNRLRVSKPTSFPDKTALKVVMGDLARKMGYTLRDNDIKATLSKGYFDNSFFKQAENIARQTNTVMIIENDVLILTPAKVPLPSDSSGVPVVSPENGLVGYPTFNKEGISFMSLFNPAIRYYHNVRLETRQKPVAGEWTVIGVQYQLESEVPNGAWFCQVDARQFDSKRFDDSSVAASTPAAAS